MAKTKKVTKKRIVVIEPVGQAHINATFNNSFQTYQIGSSLSCFSNYIKN